MKKTFIANRGRLIVEVLPPEDDGSKIVKPDNVVDPQAKRRAKILAVGGKEIAPDGSLVANIFEVGDIVILSIYTQLEQIIGVVCGVRFSEVIALETDENGN